MKILSLANEPLLDSVLKMQRDLSLAKDEESTVFAFVRRLSEVTGITHVLDLNVLGLAPGEFRIMDQIWIADPELSRSNVRDNCRWQQPLEEVGVQRSEIISRLILGDDPKAISEVEPEQDHVLKEMLPSAKNGLAVPIYFDGEVIEWIIVFRAPGQEVTPAQLRLAIANLNLLARSVFQIRLTQEITELHHRLEHQLSEVAQVQRWLLPEALPEVDGMRFAVSYRPCQAAGGDYYGFRHFADGRIGISIADVSGHGPGSAVVMAILRTVLTACSDWAANEQLMLNDINRLMLDATRDGTFVTALFAAIDPATGRATLVNAGHPPPLVRRADGRVEVIETDASPPLGILTDLPSLGGEFQLNRGDVLMLYTDGITEAFNREREQFGLDRIKAILRQAPADVDSIVDQILTSVDAFAGGHAHGDDQCLLVVARQEQP